MAKILFIDDDILTLELMGKSASLLGYNPILCDSGMNSLALLEKDKPDIIFVDHSLADIDGISLIKKIRAQPTVNGIGIIMLSAGHGSIDADSAILAGANKYIQKPISLDALAATIHEFVEVG